MEMARRLEVTQAKMVDRDVEKKVAAEDLHALRVAGIEEMRAVVAPQSRLPSEAHVGDGSGSGSGDLFSLQQEEIGLVKLFADEKAHKTEATATATAMAATERDQPEDVASLSETESTTHRLRRLDRLMGRKTHGSGKDREKAREREKPEKKRGLGIHALARMSLGSLLPRGGES